ncbi:histone PARylation factor 1 [Trichonephila clavipes]|nr:histone PARylation factor 1 [Trichonephila clavipes]
MGPCNAVEMILQNSTPEKESSDIQNNVETSETREETSSEAKFAETVGEVLDSMPADFFEFWNFCKTVNEVKPEDAFSELGLQLTGIYDILSKQLPKTKKVVLHCHYRYYYDPPELLTVITSNDKNLYHIGYFRDEPDKHPSVLVSNSAAVGPKLTLKGDNIFAAMNTELAGRLKKLKQTVLKNKFSKIQENLQKYAKKKKYSLEISTAKTKARSKKVNSKTFNDFGIVVPVANDVGYRPLPDSNELCVWGILLIVLGKVTISIIHIHLIPKK